VIPDIRHVTNASVKSTIDCPPVSFQDGSLSLVMWRIQIPGRITIELSVRRFDHQATGGDLEGDHVPPG